MKQSDVKKIVDHNTKIYENLSSYISNYVKWVEKNIPEEDLEFFGVGIAGSHGQFGDVYGFANGTCEHTGNTNYCDPGEGFYIAGDFNAWVAGCTKTSELREFVKSIPDYMSEGIKRLKENNQENETLFLEISEKYKFD